MALTYISMNPDSVQQQGQSPELEKDFLFHSKTVCIELLKNKERIIINYISNFIEHFLDYTVKFSERMLHAHDVRTHTYL